jgi:hypothetical protein
MNSIKTHKQLIIETYYLTIKEYFDKIQESDVISKSQYSVTSLSVGLNAIHRVFEYMILKTKNIDKAYYQSQQTYFFFLEYIEQIVNSGLTNKLNHLDAVMFVYKKSIFEFHDGINDNSHTLSNIMTLTNESVNINDKEWKKLFMRISKFLNVLFNWNNNKFDFNFRIQLSKLFLQEYLLNIERLDFITFYLEYIQENFVTYPEKYIDLLKNMLIKNDKTKRIRSGSITEQEKNDVVIEKVTTSSNMFKDYYENKTMKEFVRWLYKS